MLTDAVPATSTPAAAAPAPRAGADRRQWTVGAIAAGALFAVYTTLSVLRHRALETSGYDLGIFEQEVRSYASGHWPTSTLKGPGFPLLGDHFSPIVALIAPLYRMAPSPVTLLVVQAALLAVAVVPLARWADRRAGRATAVVVSVAYGLSWGIAQTVGFDFHEVAFAVPLLAFAAVALAEGRLVAAVVWAAPLVLVKEDLGLTLAAVGALVAGRGRPRWGLAAIAGGILATIVEMGLIIPAVNPDRTNAYASSVDGHLGANLIHILQPDTKIATLVLVLAPTAFLAGRSPLALLAVPTLLWRFLADNPAYWGTRFHYSAVLMPIVFAAFVDVLIRDPARRGPRLAASLLLTVVLLPGAPFAELAAPHLWSPDTTATQRLLDEIPAGTTVAASNWLAPQLTADHDVSLFLPATLTSVRPEYIVVDTEAVHWFPLDQSQTAALVTAAQEDGYTVIDRAGAVELLHQRRT